MLWPTALTLQVTSRAPVETATQEMDTTVAVSQHVVELDKHMLTVDSQLLVMCSVEKYCSVFVARHHTNADARY